MQATYSSATVGELVVERPSRARVFEKLGIDYCCGGKLPLEAACQAKGLDVQHVADELDRESAQPGEPHNWATATLTELADHIEQAHHAFLRRELPRLEAMLAKVVSRHGPRHPELSGMRQVFAGLKWELEQHMMKEEQILFPMCRAMEQATEMPQFHCGSIDRPIEVMIQEHDDAGDALVQLRRLSGNYTPPADACLTFQAMYDGLRELEQDLHEHIHKENNILFPAAIRMERQLRR